MLRQDLPGEARLTRAEHPSTQSRETKTDRLTPREYEVMDLMLSGKCAKEIAFQLGINANTVRIHARRVMEKMGCNSIVELVRSVDKLLDAAAHVLRMTS